MVVSAAALLILGILFYLLSPADLFRRKVTVFVYVPDANGLAGNSPVRLNGIDIGQIDAVTLTNSRNPNRIVQVRLSIYDRDLAKIPVDSAAQISSDNMLGDRFLDITTGVSTRHIQPGGEIQFQPATDVMKNIDLRQFAERLRQIDSLIADIQAGRGPVGKFFVGDTLYRDTLLRVQQLEDDLRAAASTTTPVGQLLYSDAAYRRLREPILRLDQQLAGIQNNSLLSSSAQYDDLRNSVVSLRRSLEGVARSPWIATDDGYQAWNRQLAALIAQIDAFASGQSDLGRMLQNASLYESLTGRFEELRKFAHEFRTDPQKFMRFKLF
jgi:hypothetical protein